MARLPQPGGDDGSWGDILNEYLRQAHNTDGSLKPQAVSTSTIQNAAVTADKLDPSLLAKINSIGSGGQGGSPGTNATTQWTPEQQAKAQGYWIVYGDKPPTQTEMYGVPVIWARREGMTQPIPVVPSPPSFP